MRGGDDPFFAGICGVQLNLRTGTEFIFGGDFVVMDYCGLIKRITFSFR